MAPQLPKKKKTGRPPNNKKSTPYQREQWRRKYYARKAKALGILFIIVLCLSSLTPFVKAEWDSSEKEDFKQLGFANEWAIYEDGEILFPYQTGIPDNQTRLKVYDSSTFEELHDYLIGTDPLQEDAHGTPAIIKFGDYYVAMYGEHSQLGTLKVAYSLDKENWTVYNFTFNGDLDYTYIYLFPWDGVIHLFMREHGRVDPIEDMIIWRIYNCTDITTPGTWSLESTVINGGTTEAAYAISRIVDDGSGNDRLLLTWGAYNRTSSLYLKTISAAYSDDLVDWYGPDGVQIDLPLNNSNSLLATLNYTVRNARAEAYNDTIWLTPHWGETANSLLVKKVIGGAITYHDFDISGSGGELFYHSTDDKVTLFMAIWGPGWGVRRYEFEDSTLTLKQIYDTPYGTNGGLIRRIHPEEDWVVAVLGLGAVNENVNNILICTDYNLPNATLSLSNLEADDWVFEGKKRYDFEVTFTSKTLTDVDQVGMRFEDAIGDTHIIWYDRDANTLTVTSPEDGISGWLTSIEQTGTNVTATFQIMFNSHIPDSYDVQIEVRLVTATDTGWVYPEADEFSIYNLGGLSTLTTSGTAGRVTGGDVFEIYAADTRTKNIIPVQDFDVRNVPLQEGWQVGGVQIIPAGDEQALLEELEGWKTWMTSRTETRTIYPTNRLPDTGVSGDLTYNSYPFGLLIKSDTTTNQSIIIEREFFRKIEDSDDELVTVEVWAAVANDTKITGQILISDDGYVDDLIKGVNTDTKRIVDFKFYGNGNIRLVNGTSGNIYPATYTGMVWANYTFVMNMTAQTYDFYVDEVLKESDIEFREAATSVGHISFLDTLNPVLPAQPVEFYVDDIRAYTDFDADYGGYAEATMLFNQLQHWSMDFDFFVESGQVYAQGASGTPQRTDDDYSDYGYIELGWDVMIDETWVEDFLVARVNISDGYISGKNNWVKYNVTWYVQGDYVKNDLLYGLFEGYSIFPGSNKDTSGFHWDMWFNRANASTVIGARINTEYYGMSDKSKWWAVWSSSWKPMRAEVSESTIFANLEDVNGTIHSAKDVGLVRSKVKVLRNTLAQFAYKVVNIAGLDFMVAKDTMSGIDTPPIRDTVIPDVLSGFFGSALGGIFAAALKRLGNALSGFGMDFFSMSIDFIDNVFASLGYPALVSTIFGWMDTLFSFVPILLGYGMTLIGNIYTLINTSASDALTQATSLITIWAGMYATVQDFITGVYTPGLNLWNDLGVSNMIKIGGVLYPLWLFMMFTDKGMQAVFDHLNSVLNIASFFLNFILNIGGFFMNLLTALIGAIRG